MYSSSFSVSLRCSLVSLSFLSKNRSLGKSVVPLVEISVPDPFSNSSDLDADFVVSLGDVKNSDRFFSGDGFSFFLYFLIS